MAPVDNPAGLIAISAIQSANRSYLFYSRPNGELAYLKSQAEQESNAPLYKSANIIVGGNVVVANTKSPQIAAVSYSLKGHDQIRVYYISDQGYLQELCQTDGGDWYIGSLNESETTASPKSLLTASVNYANGGSLKLYYNRAGNSNMWVTWVTLGEQDWAERQINHGY